jgi:peptidyl-prolyl cis-trans isomerase A (cyclophilin A)
MTNATMQTNHGVIEIELFDDDAPKTVDNFSKLARDGFYNGVIFHRVIPDFMIQGGDPTGTGMGGPGYRFQDETKGSPHSFDKPGKLAMANSGPNTNGCQFFITVAATSWLTGRHTIFGEVIEGQDIADKISKVARNAQDKPHKDVVLESVTIERVA